LKAFRGRFAATLAVLATLGTLATLAAGLAQAADSPEDDEFFEKRIRPILVQRCWECHGADDGKRRGSLRLDSREGLLRGGESGPAVVAGDPAASLLIEAIRFESSRIEMPPSGKLPEREIADLVEWVRRGAPFPQTATVANGKRGIDWEAGRRHWAFQPLTPRRIDEAAWQRAVAASQGELVEAPRSSIDIHVRAALPERDLSPAPVATRVQLVRRLKFDLLGLPPTPEEAAEFVADEAPDAYERLVDRWLASPRHGERHGRYWLDLARYCDVPESWREGEARAYHYRDWVIAAVNADLPYDEFIRRQLAADQLPGAQPTDNAALGFLGLSPSYWKELKLDPGVIKQIVADEWEERVEAIGATFLGLTLACARCHDHKFDPVSTQDYYALAGVLANIRQQDVAVIDAASAAAAATARKRVKELDAELGKLRARKMAESGDAERIATISAEVQQLKATPHFELPPAFGIADASLHVLPDGPNRTKLEYRSEPIDLAVQIRGNPNKTGASVPRRFLTALSPAEPSSRFVQGSGRRELAEAIVDSAGPLTARVAVNRIWWRHFGRGFVATPSNFGLQTERPPHGELLDELAGRFIASGWSNKALRRDLVCSATYRQSSYASQTGQHAAGMRIDPDNAWLWRMPLRRLDVEAWRDAMLAAADDLESRLGGPPIELTDVANRRRTVYGLVKRRELADILRLNDFPDPVAHSPAREPTTTPLQQLFTMNNPLVRKRGEALADRVLRQAAADTERIGLLYAVTFSRPIESFESEAGLRYLAAMKQRGLAEFEGWTRLAQSLLASNEFLFVD
jgi:cytochrome c553/mono/diheme cytochrome c family protein